MATLTSPGVSVSVINESFYTPASPGTIPLIFLASASNKSNSSSSGTAVGTLNANAGKVYTITSQRDLVDTFGTPYFETDASGNPVNGGELNEYGLQAAYSLLGVSSQVQLVRADVDLGQLTPQSSAPNGAPVDRTYWVDTANSLYGVSQWDNSAKVFSNITPLVINNDNTATAATFSMGDYQPLQSFGNIGSYAMVVTSQNTNALWYKNFSNTWVEVGTNNEPNFASTVTTFDSLGSSQWQSSWPIAVSSLTSPGSLPVGNGFSINGQPFAINSTASWAAVAASINNGIGGHGVGAAVWNGTLAIFADATAASNGSTVDGKVLMTGANVAVFGFTTTVYQPVSLAVSPHTQVPRFNANSNPSGSVWIKTTTPSSGANWAIKYYNAATASWGSVSAPMYASSDAAIYALDKSGGKAIPAGTVYIESNYNHGDGLTTSTQKLAEFQVNIRKSTGATVASFTPANPSFNDNATFKVSETLAGVAGFQNENSFSVSSGNTVTDFVSAFNGAGLTNVVASYDGSVVAFTHALGGDFRIVETGATTQLARLGFTTAVNNVYSAGEYNADNFKGGLRVSNWTPLSYEATAVAPFTSPADGQLWYSPVVSEVDILINHTVNGTPKWVGYRSTNGPYAGVNTSVIPYVAATAPSNSSLQDGDIWVSTADIEMYGKEVYVYSSGKWVLQDTTDHVSPNGWVFADARWSGAGDDIIPDSIQTLLTYDYVDPDCPDPALYPEGTRLWNTRRSGFNVKKFVVNHINVNANDGINVRTGESMSNYVADRWVTDSPVDEHGVGTFGRLSQRAVVVSKLKSVIDQSQAVRDTDSLVFNLIACPGYPETVQNMVSLNSDRSLTAFVIGDTPFRLASDATSLAAWGINANGALDNNDVGAVTYDDNLAFYYPSGYTNDNLGNNIVVPPSHIMLRTIARSDSVSYPWFAPAGTRRGTVDNVSSVGYVDSSTGEFVKASLYEGLRNVMSLNGHVNPIASLTGVGLTVMGEYTRSSGSSALDRIGVARLVCYLRRQLTLLSRPFLFEPNDNITRSTIKAATESLLLDLVSKRALHDFIVVCDESNNTAARIDRNELWMDIAIEPIKAVEFIYIPMRLVNTGAIAAGLGK
jgi:Phage tail sheath C-terminal domain